MNILGIDYGEKRIGLAWVDTTLGVALPYGVIQNNESLCAIDELLELIKKERVQKVVIGLPLGLDGYENANTKIVRIFVQTLKAKIDIPIELMDERFSSAQADRMEGGVSRDEKAAMVILQAYLESRK